MLLIRLTKTSEDITMFLPVCLLLAFAADSVAGDKRLVMHSDLDLATTLGHLQHNLSDVGNKVLQQESRIAQLEAENQQQKTRVAHLEAENTQQKTQVAHLEAESKQQMTRVAHLEAENTQLNTTVTQLTSSGKGGSVYVRWGRNSCPGNGTDLIYKGIIGGNMYSSNGGAPSSLCLPESPTWNKYVDGFQGSKSEIYGTEVEESTPAFSTKAFGYNYNNQDPPCATCHTQRTSVVMIPGRSNCYPGWTMEYTGYLVGGFPAHTSSDYICLDSRPEERPNGLDSHSGDQHILYFVEAHCGSLPCPPYHDGREVACTVCSK